MEKLAFENSIENTFNNAFEIIQKKFLEHADESDAFRSFRMAEMVGVPVEKAILIRLMDKVTRLISSANESHNTEGDMQDTIVDAINYLAILKAYTERGNIAENLSSPQGGLGDKRVIEL